MKATIILNPRSGKKRALTIQERALSMAQELGVELTVRVIDGVGHGTELAREAVTSGRTG